MGNIGKIKASKPLNNFFMLIIISFFEGIAAISAAINAQDILLKLLFSIAVLILVEWIYVAFMYFAFHRRNFELEFIAFFLTAVGLITIGSIDQDACFKQLLIAFVAILGYTIIVFVMGNLELCMKLRMPVAIIALLLLVLNLAIAKTTNGARNWITIMGITIQPSEFVKVMFIFVGAATLEKIQTSKNIIKFIVFAVACVGSLIIMRDFGTALIFFVTFLIIAFMNSGDIKTIILAIASAALGGAIVLKFKSYVLDRFAVYRHVWEDYNGKGFQQTRVLVGIASGGLLGLGLGNGKVRNVFASTTDLIFGVICEEWGLLFGVILVLTFVFIAASALVNSIAARSTFYSITAVAGAGLLLFQTALNIFGITDILPLTGVTLPFVSQGGSSMISCWAILALIKASDARTYNYLGGKKRK